MVYYRLGSTSCIVLYYIVQYASTSRALLLVSFFLQHYKEISESVPLDTLSTKEALLILLSFTIRERERESFCPLLYTCIAQSDRPNQDRANFSFQIPNFSDDWSFTSACTFSAGEKVRLKAPDPGEKNPPRHVNISNIDLNPNEAPYSSLGGTVLGDWAQLTADMGTACGY